ncbi:MAG: hypothetical protein IPF41_17200 [Flavobacteriales bacterium]|nr:hypothetical protein [Flavobacteriales bacterium]
MSHPICLLHRNERWRQDGAPFSTEPCVRANRRAQGRRRSAVADLRFAGQRSATVHLTYSAVQPTFLKLTEDAHEFKRKHEVKAARIRSERMLRDSACVFGTLSDVEGDVASPSVFYLTDSTDTSSTARSTSMRSTERRLLAPVTARLRADISGTWLQRWSGAPGNVRYQSVARLTVEAHRIDEGCPSQGTCVMIVTTLKVNCTSTATRAASAASAPPRNRHANTMKPAATSACQVRCMN